MHEAKYSTDKTKHIQKKNKCSELLSSLSIQLKVDVTLKLYSVQGSLEKLCKNSFFFILYNWQKTKWIQLASKI